ncbi:hypothetical protein B0H13DRAFT_2302650 [Mycena leptocephala]|nr:hypothetical protein B0H13DRAFT_2302650 [Mycena leptocephala]
MPKKAVREHSNRISDLPLSFICDHYLRSLYFHRVPSALRYQRHVHYRRRAPCAVLHVNQVGFRTGPPAGASSQPLENTIMPNAVVTILNTLTGLYSTHTVHLIVQSFPLSGRAGGTMPLPLPTEPELRIAHARCQPEQPSIPNPDFLTDLHDAHSLFHHPTTINATGFHPFLDLHLAFAIPRFGLHS